jgi:DNA-directed RNA polymerase specialized sigma24 family protein
VRTAPDEALHRLYAEQSQPLLGLATLLVWALVPGAVAEVAEEIVHEAFAGMHHDWRRLRSADKAVAYLRRTIVRRARLLAAAAHGGDHASAVASTSDEVLAALRVMPDHQAEALVLRYYANLPEAQAADAMGVTRGAFRWHVAQGMTSLRAFLDQGPLSKALSTAKRRLSLAYPQHCAQHVHSVIHNYQFEVAGRGIDGLASSPAGVVAPGAGSLIASSSVPFSLIAVSGSLSAAMASRYRRNTIVATAPAAARTVADRAVHARADRSDRLRRTSAGVTCRAVVRSAADTRGATCLVSAAETAGAAVDVV